MIPIPTFLIAPAIAAAVGFGSAWKIQSWRADANEKDHIAMHAAQERELHVLDQKRQTALAAAQSAANTAEIALRDDATRNRNASERLRTSTARALSRAAASAEACTVTAAALGVVFGECQQEYGALAEKAGRHVIDIRKITADRGN